MKIRTSGPFDHDYAKLPLHIKKRADKQFAILLQDPHYPGLRVKKMEGRPGNEKIFEARVTEGYRFTFQILGDEYILRRIGPHDILRTP